MRIFTTLVSAAALSVSGIAASAAGYDDVVVVQPVVSPVAEESLADRPLAGSLGGAGLAIGVLGALALIALASDNDEDDATPGQSGQPG